MVKVQRGDLLLKRFISGHPAAAGEIRRLVSRVVSYAGYYIPCGEREDIIQEALLCIWREIVRPDFRVRRDFGALVKKITYRRCVDWMRRDRQLSPLADETLENGDPPDVALQDRERQELRDKVLALLRPACRELIRLRLDGGMSYREIAGAQGRSEESVRRQWCDCLKEAGKIREGVERRGGPKEKS